MLAEPRGSGAPAVGGSPLYAPPPPATWPSQLTCSPMRPLPPACARSACLPTQPSGGPCTRCGSRWQTSRLYGSCGGRPRYPVAAAFAWLMAGPPACGWAAAAWSASRDSLLPVPSLSLHPPPPQPHPASCSQLFLGMEFGCCDPLDPADLAKALNLGAQQVVVGKFCGGTVGRWGPGLTLGGLKPT
jgi:hypothetical protein